MISHNSIFSSLFFFNIIFTLNAALTPQSDTKIFGKAQGYGKKEVLALIDKMQPGKDSLFGNQFFLRDQTLRTLLKNKANEGVKIEIIVDGGDVTSIENAKELAPFAYVFNRTGTIPNNDAKILKNNKWVQAPISLHDKTYGWSIGTERFVWSGSKNDGNKSEENFELMALDKNPAIYEDALKEHMTLLKLSTPVHQENAKPVSPWAENTSGVPPFPKTPEIPRRFSSFEHGLAQSLSLRIANGDQKLLMSLYSLDHDSVIDQIKAAAKKGILKEVIANHDLIDKVKSQQVLLSIAKMGTAVYIFNHDKSQQFFNYPLDNHAKFIFREQQDGSTLIEIGSANPTKKNNRDINHSTYYPNNKKMNSELLAIFDQIKKESILIQEIPEYKTYFQEIEKKGTEKAVSTPKAEK